LDRFTDALLVVKWCAEKLDPHLFLKNRKNLPRSFLYETVASEGKQARFPLLIGHFHLQCIVDGKETASDG